MSDCCGSPSLDETLLCLLLRSIAASATSPFTGDNVFIGVDNGACTGRRVFFSTDAGNSLTLGTDGGMLASGGAGVCAQPILRFTADIDLNGDVTLANACSMLILDKGEDATDVFCNVCSNAQTPYPIGTRFDLVSPSGKIAFSNTAGVTINSVSATRKTRIANAGCTILKTNTDEWYLFGDLAP